MLSTFYAWSIEHIKRVFEAKSERDCLEALDATFSERLEFTFNGSPLPRVGLEQHVQRPDPFAGAGGEAVGAGGDGAFEDDLLPFPCRQGQTGVPGGAWGAGFGSARHLRPAPCTRRWPC